MTLLPVHLNPIPTDLTTLMQDDILKILQCMLLHTSQVDLLALMLVSDKTVHCSLPVPFAQIPPQFYPLMRAIMTAPDRFQNALDDAVFKCQELLCAAAGQGLVSCATLLQGIRKGLQRSTNNPASNAHSEGGITHITNSAFANSENSALAQMAKLEHEFHLDY